MNHPFSRENIDNAWCPGCGNFGILNLLKKALESLNADKKNVVFVSGIGQAAKTPHYLDVHMFDGLHGRALPVATAIKAANPNLVVVAEGGDGDMYGEGGNHFLNAIRRNINIVHIVHNNMVYGLTKGQASPTSQRDFGTKVQVQGVFNEPFNPLTIALSSGATFVSRVSVGKPQHALQVLKAAFLHEGYALVDIFQACVTFNKINTYQWFETNTQLLDSTHDVSNKACAWEKAAQLMPFNLGVFYQEKKETFEQHLWQGQEKKGALYAKMHNLKLLQQELEQATS